ncbi:inorganic diphosphatase [bacterium]|nr:inorganic diphosphatase [bacterium]
MELRTHFHIIPQEQAPKILNLVVEIQKGDFIKYEYREEYGILEVDRVLHGPVHYPVIYCDVPRTWNKHDNDPLDAVLFTTGNLIPGSMVAGRVVGMMEMVDNGQKDHKIITVNNVDPRYDHVKSLDDLPPWRLKDMQHFFEIYKHAQTGPQSVTVGNFLGPKEAYIHILKSMEDYNEKFKLN